MEKEDAIKYLQQLYPNGGHCWLDEQRIEAISMAVKALQEEPVSEQNLSNVQRTVKNCKELVSEDLERASEDYCKSTLVGSPYIKKNAFKAGANWQKTKEEPVSDELEEAVDEYAPDFSNSIASKAAVDAVRDAFKAGAKWKEEQMMAKAIDAELYSDGMFVPLIGVKNKEKISNIKFGDKVKVIVIKEN